MSQRGHLASFGTGCGNVGGGTFLKTGTGAHRDGRILAAGRAPASWAARELSLLTAVNYAPLRREADRAHQSGSRRLRRQRPRGSHPERAEPAKLFAEVMSKSGHDIISLEMHYPGSSSPVWPTFRYLNALAKSTATGTVF